MFKCSKVQMFNCSNVQMFKCSNVRMFKCSNVRMFKCSNVMIAKDFEDLVIYQIAREMAKRIYTITSNNLFERDYRFVQQIRASAGSVADNIAEGFERQGNKEMKNFLYIAKGSCGELRSQINRAYDVGFIDKELHKALYNDCKKLSAAIHSFILSIKESSYVGTRYLNPSTPSNS